MVGEHADRHPELVARCIMRAAPRTVSPRDTLARAARLLDSLGTREVAVVDGAALVGILTRTDMEPYRGHFEWTTVQSVMTPDPITVSPEAPVADVVSVLTETGFNSVPVAAGGELVGMIARSDVLRALARDD